MSEICGNCGRKIGNLETAHLYKQAVVCGECLERLARRPPPKTPQHHPAWADPLGELAVATAPPAQPQPRVSEPPRSFIVHAQVTFAAYLAAWSVMACWWAAPRIHAPLIEVVSGLIWIAAITLNSIFLTMSGNEKRRIHQSPPGRIHLLVYPWVFIVAPVNVVIVAIIQLGYLAPTSN